MQPHSVFYRINMAEKHALRLVHYFILPEAYWLHFHHIIGSSWLAVFSWAHRRPVCSIRHFHYVCFSYRFFLSWSVKHETSCSFSVTENIGSKHRSWMSIAFSMSYPVGMIILALSANFLHQWRQLQLALTIPSFLLIFYCL